MTTLGTIRNVEDYIAKLWSFEIFRGCFPGTKRMPSDIDGIVDADGNLLILEGKHVGDGGLDTGQASLFNALRWPQSVASLIWWGEPPDGPIDRMRYDAPVPLLVPAPGTRGHVQKDVSLADLRDVVREWHRWADPIRHREDRTT